MYSMLRKKRLLSQNEMSQNVPPRPGPSLKRNEFVITRKEHVLTKVTRKHHNLF